MQRGTRARRPVRENTPTIGNPWDQNGEGYFFIFVGGLGERHTEKSTENRVTHDLRATSAVDVPMLEYDREPKVEAE